MALSLATLYENLIAHPESQARFVGLDGKLIRKSFADMHADVVAVMAELRACGLGARDVIGLMGPNSYHWIVADLALLGLDCVSVALPVGAPAEPVDTDALMDRYGLSAMLVGGGVGPAPHRSPSTAILGDRPIRLVKRNTDGLRRSFHPDVFTVAFSSGTAGTRKGLLLSKRGVENTIRTSGEFWSLRPDDDLLIVMPFSSFQQRYLFYTAVWHGCATAVVAPERMFQQMRVIEPTVILGPPSFFEIVESRVRRAGRREKVRYLAAVMLRVIPPDRLTRPIRARLGHSLTAMYGSRVRLMLTGSAPVPGRLGTVFHRLGAPLFEVYGSTEIGWIAVSRPGRYRIGTAGRPPKGVALNLGPDGEIVVRAEHPQALGYVFDGEETQSSVFLPDGTIATGDMGRWDHGYLKVVGRTKNVIITRSGVKINPEEIEEYVERHNAVRKAIVITNAEATALTCVVWLAEADWLEPTCTRDVEAHVSRVNESQPASHRIAKVLFRPAAELTAQTGLLTRNLKVDRNAVVRMVFSDNAERTVG